MRRLPPPSPELRVSVVVPARNEEALVGACLEALAAQEGVPHEEYEVLLVLDACTDATEARAREAGAAHPSLRLYFLDGPGKGAGHARRAGMEAACARLRSLPVPGGLIASTDADTVVMPDWLAAQLRCAAGGARAIGGRIELAGEEHLPDGVSTWRLDQGRQRHRGLLESPANGRIPEHWQFSGASLALTADLYEEIGGLEPRAALEDEYLERVLHQRGINIERPLAVRVRTSARLEGRAERGLARDLALASWYRRNTYTTFHGDVSGVGKDPLPGVSLVLPVEEEPGPGLLHELEDLRASGVVDEAIVVGVLEHPGSSPPGVTVYSGGELMPRFGPVRGYGDALWRGVSASRGELVVSVEPGLPGSLANRVRSLLCPLLEREELSLVKGFHSPRDPVSDLVARPLINLYRPELAGLVEPLSLNLAARRSLLEELSFPVGPGARLSLVLDTADRQGAKGIAQVYLGEKRCGAEGESASGYTQEVAYAVLCAAATRFPGGGAEGGVVPGPLFVPEAAELGVRRVSLEERPPLKNSRPPATEIRNRQSRHGDVQAFSSR